MRLIRQIRQSFSSIIPKETPARKSKLAKSGESAAPLTEQKRQEELEKLMRIYLKPPTYDQSLQEYEKYLNHLSKSDSFKGQFLAKDLQLTRKVLGKKERSVATTQLIAGSFFGMVALLVLYKFFYGKTDSRLGDLKGRYLKDRLRLWIYGFGLSPKRKQWNEYYFDLVALAPECFWAMPQLRHAIIERFNHLLRFEWIENAILEYSNRALLVGNLIKVTTKINDKADAIVLSMLTRLIPLIRKDPRCLTKDSIDILTKLLPELPRENPNSVFISLAILQIIRLNPDISEEYELPSPISLEPEVDIFANYRLASTSFKQFVMDRIRRADELAHSIARPKAIKTYQ